MAYVSCLLVLAALVAVAVLTWEDNGGSAPVVAAPEAAEVAVVARRVEQLRGLRFATRPVPETVTPQQARREGLRELDRDYPAARRRADEQVLTLLGLLEPGTDLRDVSASVFAEQVAGYYDPRSGRLRVVRGASTSTPVLADITLAHELVHAVEDQRFGLRTGPVGDDDRELAYLGLVEGTATAVMLEYAERYVSAGEALGGLLPAALDPSGEQLPPFVLAQLLFPYQAGRAFVADLIARAGGRWTLVDLALETRPPVSTEQILHPETYIAAETPLPVRVAPAPAVLGLGWRRVHAGTLGEWGTGMVLSAVPGEAADATGWGGDRYELWSGPAGRTALIVRWRWDDRAGLRRLERRLRRYAAERDGARVVRRGGVVTLGIAGDSRTAAALAAAG